MFGCSGTGAPAGAHTHTYIKLHHRYIYIRRGFCALAAGDPSSHRQHQLPARTIAQPRLVDFCVPFSFFLLVRPFFPIFFILDAYTLVGAPRIHYRYTSFLDGST